tara:strand:- start:405 stop:608 length:204 start_codon:yes stop_codon:yes gene_type:complete
MYKVWKVPIDAVDDPPVCGVEITEIKDFYEACDYADNVMEQEGDPESAYFVMPSTGNEGQYSVGYLS